MDPTLGPLLATLVKQGPPWVIAAIAIIFVVRLWQRCNALSDKLYELGLEMTKVNSEFTSTLGSVSRDLEEIRNTQRRTRK